MASTTTQSGLGDASLLEKIDKLFTCGVGEYIDLPQIVAVGDQSSGKSSVLEGLVNKNFPRDSGLCTRFATQFVFRRSATEGISISIIPGPNATEEQKSTQAQWRCTDLTSLDSTNFAKIMQEVHGVLGLAASNEPHSNKPTFSDSILRLEISGPSQEHLSVVDVPGIFQNTTEGLTTKDDITMVRKMVLSYMENPRSVMLIIIPSNVDVATQGILQMAREVDPEGDRTLGILTKPDLVDKGAERAVLDMLNGHTVKMQLGWHVVRNPGQLDLDNLSVQRGQLESDFFRKTSPWSALDVSKTGVDTLRTRLNEVLASLVKKEFPRVTSEVSKKLAHNTEALHALGMERTTTKAQESYLIDLSVRFQHVASKAIGSATDSTFDQTPALKLATAVTSRMDTFEEDMAKFGHTHPFGKAEDSWSKEITAEWTRPIVLPNARATTVSKDSAVSSSIPLVQNTADAVVTEGINTRKTNDIADLADLLQPNSRVSRGEVNGIMTWLTAVYKESRGFEIGTFNPTILSSIMRQQSTEWNGISLGLTSDIIVLVHQCFLAALELIVPDRAMRSKLTDILLERLVDKYSIALENTRLMLFVEHQTIPYTINHYLQDNLQKARADRLTARMKQHSVTFTGETFVPLAIATSTTVMSNTEQTIHDLHDILQAYYKVARKRFTDNIVMQSILHHLIAGPDTPLSLFCPEMVSRLTDEELDSIAGEAPSARRKREQLNKEIASLTEAKSILRRGAA